MSKFDGALRKILVPTQKGGEFILDSLLSLSFQTQCILCERISALSPCSTCLEPEVLKSPRCRYCALELPLPLTVCGRCENLKWDYDQLHSYLWFQGGLRRLYTQIKFLGQIEYLFVYKKLLALTSSPFPQNALLLPVPLYWERLCLRNFHPSLWLAQELENLFGNPMNSHHLKKIKNTASQSRLSLEQRLKNLKKCFKWDGENLSQEVVLIDDIFTTGTTLNQCAKVLKKAGVPRVHAWTLFRTPPLPPL